jgi:hypothetical protein
MGAVRPQTPHRSPRQAFGGNFSKGRFASQLEKMETGWAVHPDCFSQPVS